MQAALGKLKVSFLSSRLHSLCNMKQKIGDWFLDVAKYILTAFLLSSLFSDMDKPFVVAGVLCSFAAAFAVGIYLIKKGGKDGNN